MSALHATRAYRIQRDALMRTVTPWSTCWRCGRLLLEHAPHRNGKPARWTAGHLRDGDPTSPLLLEASTCNYRAGVRLLNGRSNKGTIKVDSRLR